MGSGKAGEETQKEGRGAPRINLKTCNLAHDSFCAYYTYVALILDISVEWWIFYILVQYFSYLLNSALF